MEKNNLIALLTLVSLLGTSGYYFKTSQNFENFEVDLLQENFEAWKSLYKKSYGADENQYRFTIYKTNYQFIQENNSPLLSYTLGENEFMDLTNQEFSSLFTGL